jgi:non-ribosomal peptide synthetase component F
MRGDGPERCVGGQSCLRHLHIGLDRPTQGVEVEHRSLLSLIDIAGAEFGMCCADVVPLFHSFAFDVSVWEIWTALAYGGRLVIVRADRKDPASMVELLRAHRVTVLNQTPTAFSALIPALALTNLGELDLASRS